MGAGLDSTEHLQHHRIAEQKSGIGLFPPDPLRTGVGRQFQGAQLFTAGESNRTAALGGDAAAGSDCRNQGRSEAIITCGIDQESHARSLACSRQDLRLQRRSRIFGFGSKEQGEWNEVVMRGLAGRTLHDGERPAAIRSFQLGDINDTGRF